AYDSGLPSGIFLPILTMGALIGATYGMFMVQLGLLPERLVVNLVIFSMAGYFAAIIRAPFTAIILITEMVGSLLHLMPLAVVAFIALLVDELLGGKPIYGLLAAAMDTSSDRKANYTGEADQMVLPVYESSKLVDKKVADIKWPDDTRVRTIRRDGGEIIPTGQTIIRGGDMLVLEFDSSQRGRVYSKMKDLQGVELDG
ncbi:MAG: chloride channel protein, partial [Lactobacillus amylovorus]